MNRLKKLLANPCSPFVIDLLAHWNNKIFPHDKPAQPYHYQPLLDNDQQHEYDNLLIDVDLASVNTDVQPELSSDEESEHLVHKAYKSQRYTSLTSDTSRSDAPESGEGEGSDSDDGKQELDSGGGEEDELEVYEPRGSEYVDEEHHSVLMSVAQQRTIHETAAT